MENDTTTDFSYMKMELLKICNGDLEQAKRMWDWVKPF